MVRRGSTVRVRQRALQKALQSGVFCIHAFWKNESGAVAGERTGLYFIPPGQPWRNVYVESFNSRVRDECLNIKMFWSLAQARVVISDWKEDYNHRQRHSALGYQAPTVYAAARTNQ